MDLRRPGTLQRAFRIFLIGELAIEDEGIRFIAAVKSPEGYLPQDEFDKIYWYNAHFNDFFVAYKDIESFTDKGKLKTKDGRKFRFSSREMQSLAPEIRMHLGAQ